ncbi:MAG: methyl-accepting chemotaxis protein [Chlamydiales bacterium]|nr:methyl-accepting chemotaxis protein [Chlamydiales bacterium]
MVKAKPLGPSDARKPKKKFLQRFTFAQKFSFICFQFALVVATVLSLMLHEQNQDVAAARRALIGLQYFRPIQTLDKYISEHQEAGQRFLLGDTSLENVVTHLQQRISAGFNDLTDAETNIGPELFSDRTPVADWHQSSVAPAKLKQQWEELNSSFAKLTPEASLTKHVALLNNLQTLAGLVGDSSSLVLGDDLVSYYLTNMIFVEIPLVQANVLYAASISELVATKKEIRQSEREDLAGHIALAEHALDAISNSLWKASQARKNLHEDLELKAAMEDPYTELSSAIANFISTLKKSILKPQKIDVEPGSLAVSSSRAINESFQFAELGTEQLERFLKESLDLLEFQRRTSAGLVLGMSFLAFLSSFILLRAMLSPLQKLVGAAEQLAKGNLGVRVDVGQSDEVSQVGLALNKMAASIEEVLANLQHAGVQLTTSTTEIAAAAKEQETTIVQQETATKQIAVTAKEISATASEFANYIHEVTSSAEETSGLAATGKEGLSKLKNIMKQMVDATTEIADKLSSLNEKTGVITGVITTITKVADRTNLLSLNAAIEAHKLGARGGSFGVIATEIRRLADQTAYATLDIEKVVHQMVAAVSTSVEGVAKFSEDIRQGVKQANAISGLLTKIIAQVQQQTASFESVNQGMETQSSGAKQITDSIEELSEAAQQSTASIRQFHAALAHLSTTIKELQSTVARLQHEPSQMPPPIGTPPNFTSPYTFPSTHSAAADF